MTAVTEPALVDVLAITEEVWASFVDPDEPLLPGEPEEFPVGWAAAVSVSGSWAGTVVVEMPDTAAFALASRMLLTASPTPTDVADAVGEIANMVGGNIKCLVEGDNDLSLPVVCAGPVSTGTESTVLCSAHLLWSQGTLRITVHAPKGEAR